MSDQAGPIGAEGVVEALANQLLHAEGEQTVRDIARHVGDEVHGVLKRHGMLMKTTAGAIGVGVLAAVNVLADTLEFARRSMDEDQERAEISAAIRTLFVDLAPSELGLAATPDSRAAGAEREAACKLVFLLGAYGGYYAGMGISARNRSGSNWVKDPSRAKLLTPDDATEVAKREGGKVVDPPALRAVDAAPGGGVEREALHQREIVSIVCGAVADVRAAMQPFVALIDLIEGFGGWCESRNFSGERLKDNPIYVSAYLAARDPQYPKKSISVPADQLETADKRIGLAIRKGAALYLGGINRGDAFVMDYGADGEELVRIADVQPADDACCKVRLAGTTWWLTEFDFRRRATPVTATPTAAPAPNAQALVEALMWYADPLNYDTQIPTGRRFRKTVVQLDYGTRASEALAAIQAPAGEGVKEGPQPIPSPGLSCNGCVHLKTEDWREPSGDGETFDRGTSAECGAIPGERHITAYWNKGTRPPVWCPFAEPTPPAGDRGQG